MIKDYTPSQRRVADFVSQGRNMVILGKPGTGKTELIRDIAERERKKGKTVLMTASTGLAASSLDGGRTIHSVLGWKPKNPFPDLDRACALLSSADILIIDEVSMLTPGIMYHIAACLHHVEKPIQIIFCGDFFQLPPVNPKKLRIYPFDTSAWKELNPVPCVLDEIVRQADPEFKYELGLAMVADPRCIRYFNTKTAGKPIDGAVTLCTNNKDADSINKKKLDALTGCERKYAARGDVDMANFSDSRVKKTFSAKLGMRVMALWNDSAYRYQNGSMGTIKSMSDDTITVQYDNGNEVDMQRITYAIDNIEKGKTAVSIEQFPLRAAYAITIHKSQGQTFDYINIKAPHCWEPGQLYVALSRARSVNGIYLMDKITEDSLITDTRVKEYYNSLKNGYVA